MAEFNLRMQKYHDGSVLGLRLYMWRYWMSYQNRRFWESYWPAFMRSKDKKNTISIFSDLIRLTWKWKCLPYHYFRYGLYGKKLDYQEIINYLPETVFFYQILPVINKQMFLLDDKNVFEELIIGHNIKYPKTVIKLTKQTIFGNEIQIISDQEELKRVLQLVKSDLLFCKPADCGSGGKGIFVLRRSKDTFIDDNGDEINFNYLERMAKADWIIQESVENCQILRSIYEYATNSFRVLTYFQPKVGAKAIYCILKFGNNKAYTDNAHTGGVYVKVDLENGELDETAFDENLFSYKAHPLTGVVFKGKKISEIKEVIALAEKLGNIFPRLTFIGWDIALTPDGPVVLEGNSSPGLTIIQRTYGGMKEFIDLARKEGVSI